MINWKNALGLGLLIALCVLAVNAANATTPDDRAIRIKAMRTTFMVQTNMSMGTAFHIGGNVYVTAGHVVDGAVLFQIGGESATLLDYADDGSGLDYALLAIEGPPADQAKALDPECRMTPAQMQGRRVYIVGVPLGYATMVEAFILVDLDDGRLLVAPQGLLGPGVSGGAVIDAETGKVLGLVSMGMVMLTDGERHETWEGMSRHGGVQQSIVVPLSQTPVCR